MVGIHGGLPIFCFLHVATVVKFIDVPPTAPKKQTASHNLRPSFLLSAVVDSSHKPRFAKPRDKVYYGNITLAFM
jgi:hypothetical protein